MSRAAADQLRGRVVLRVLTSVQVLAAGLYLLIGLLLWHRGQDSVPDALWLAAGAAAQALYGWLVNSKDDRGPMEVTAPPGEPLPVEVDEGLRDVR